MSTDVTIVGSLAVGQATKLAGIELSRDYDLVIGALSWERRAAAALTATSNISGQIHLLRFASITPEVDRAKQATLRKFEERFDCRIVDLAGSTEFHTNAARLESFLRDEATRLGRPLRVLIDITCIPKSYILFLTGVGFGQGYVCKFDAIYAEGDYSGAAREPDVSPDSAVGLVSEGGWDSLQIPYLGAESAIPSRRDLLVMMGGEIELSLPFIEKYEPRSLGLVLIQEGLVQTPDALSGGERRALEELLSEPNVERSDIGLCDVVTLARRCVEFCRQSKADAVSGIALGAKPHALALGVAALSEDNLEVICRVPKRYRTLDVPAAGAFAFYEIEDRFEPSAYF